MPKARSWRKTRTIDQRTTEPRKPPTMAQEAMPTVERLRQAEGAFKIGNRRAVFTMMDAPLERIYNEQHLTETQYEALRRFRLHWFLGISGRLGAIDLERTRSEWSGLEQSERELMHRQAFNTAWARLCLVRIQAVVVNSVVLVEAGLTSAGAELGYRSPYRGRQAALEQLQGGGDTLAEVWRTYAI